MVSFVFRVNYANFLYCILKLDLKGKLRLEALLKFSFYSSSFFIYLMILVEAVKKCLKQKRFQNHPFSSSPSLQTQKMMDGILIKVVSFLFFKLSFFIYSSRGSEKVSVVSDTDDEAIIQFTESER